MPSSNSLHHIDLFTLDLSFLPPVNIKIYIMGETLQSGIAFKWQPAHTAKLGKYQCENYLLLVCWLLWQQNKRGSCCWICFLYHRLKRVRRHIFSIHSVGIYMKCGEPSFNLITWILYRHTDPLQSKWHHKHELKSSRQLSFCKKLRYFFTWL